MDTQTRKLLAQPASKPNFCGKRPAGRVGFGRREMLSTGRGVALLCLIFVVLANFIRPAPDKVTMQQDAAELVRVEAQTHGDNAKPAVPAPARISNLDDGRISSKGQAYSESKTQQSSVIVRRDGSLDKKIRYRQRLRERDVQK